jgi:hypothetical protein
MADPILEALTACENLPEGSEELFDAYRKVFQILHDEQQRLHERDTACESI